MRHLFVPACLCLMALPGLTAKETRQPLDALTGRPAVNKSAASADPTDDITQTLDGQMSIAEIDPGWGASTRDKSQRDDGPDDNSIAADAAAFDPGAAIDEAETPPPPPPLPPVRRPVVDRSREEVCDAITEAAHSNNVPVPFFIHLLFQESRFHADAVSSAGAEGIAQFMPETSASVGLDNPFDPVQAIPAAARLLRNLAQQFGNLGLAAAAYNAGPKRIQDWLARKGKLPEETQGYVKTITGRAPETWTKAEVGSPALKLPRHAPCQEAAGLLAWNGPERIPLPPVREPKPKDETRVAAAESHHDAKLASAKDEKSKHADAKAASKSTAPAKSAEKKPPTRVAKSGISPAVSARRKHAHKGERLAQN